MNLPESTALLLVKLISSTLEDALNAYQIAFDVVDKENQAFTNTVRSSLNQQVLEGDAKARLAQLNNILKGVITDRLSL